MDKLKIYFCGYGGNAYLAEELRPIINELGMELITIHEHDNADIKWNKDTWLDHLKKADIIIAPANYKIQPAKSANRLTQGMSLGKPVICSPLPAYLDVAKKYPGSFLIADTQEEWKEKLILLRDTPMFRQQLSERALKAAQDYSLEAMGKKWIELFDDLKIEERPPDFSIELIPEKEPQKEPIQEDSVDIIIPTYKNLRGLKLCINSIRECTSVPYRIIVVNNGDDKEIHKYLESQLDIIYKKIEKSTFAQAVNIGLKAMTYKYAMILNDDVIVSHGWLKTMIEACTPGIGAVGPLSNCDFGWLHNHILNVDGINLLPGKNTFEEIEPIIPYIYEAKFPHSDIIERDWIAFYATLIPREVITKVGILDEEFENSGEDTDYCTRIRKLGYKIIQTYKSFVFHFGAVSRKILEKENYKEYHAADERTISYLNLKYSEPTVMLYSGPSWERWSFKSLEEGGIGGSEVWQVSVARELSELGYRVISFNDLPEPEMWEGDIKWLHYTKYPQWCEQNYADYAILSRTTDPLKFPLRAGKVFVMVHDIWLLSPREQLFLEKVNKFCVLSKWHWDFFKNHHKIPDDSKLSLTANGIDFSRYDQEVERHPYRLWYSSSPDRGLDTLLYLFPFIKEQIPELELHIHYGFNNWEKAIKVRNNESDRRRMKEIKKRMQQPGVHYRGRVSQSELAKTELSSSLWAYPTDFEEVFCITAVEAQRARVPVIASNYAALQTIVGDSGILIGNGTKGQSYTKEYREKFVEECISILKDRDKWQHWSEKGFKNTEKYSWTQVAHMWRDLFKE